MLFDAAIIGTGPAGLSAALTLKAHNKTLVWIGSKALSDKVSKAERIANYPGLPMVTGQEMQTAFQKQIQQAELTITEQMVNSILPYGDHYAIMAGSEFYEAKTVLLCTGVVMRNVLPGEAELLGKGVSYCATCDGWLYKGKKIAIISNNPRFMHEVGYLAELAESVTFLRRYREAEEVPPNVRVVKELPAAILGENNRFSAIALKNGEQIPADGVFILRDSVSMNTLLPDLCVEDGHIPVSRGQETNLPGVFAAGDCTGKPYQYAKAVGEGNVAAHSALAYLSRKKG